MILPAPLRYLAACLRYRDNATIAHYLRTGLGIESRSRKLAAYWGPHQESTRAAQQRWDARGHRLAVLGAGRLLDFDHASAARFAHLRLVDEDPFCAPFWKAHPHEPMFADISGCLGGWLESLPVHASWFETLTAIRGKVALPLNPVWLADCDAILSLNVLSQIPIGWQERVEAFLHKRFGEAYTKAREQEWLEAVDPGAHSLVDAHLGMLNESGAKSVLVVTDLAYVEYRGRAYSRRRWQPPPVRWSEGVWLAEEGVECQLSTALHGLDGILLPQYRMLWQNHWLWHIAPQGADAKDKGTVHLVGAFAFERREVLNSFGGWFGMAAQPRV